MFQDLEMRSIVRYAPSVIISLVLLYYLGIPSILKLVLKLRANPQIDIFDPQEIPLPGNVANYFESTRRQLESVGFSLVEYVSMPDQSPNVVALLMLLENRSENDLVMVTVMWGMTDQGFEKVVNLQNQHVEFATEFQDGSEIDTRNGKTGNAFAPVSHKLGIQFPDVYDAARLYRVHQRVIQENAAGLRKQPIPRTEEMTDELKRGIRKEMDGQIETGYLYLDSEEEYFYPTWKGAFWMGWKEMWPMKFILLSRRRSRARRLLTQWDL